MAFLYPSFLFASFTILLPIIIHLFNFRQHKIVYFSNITFLKSINEETKSKSQLKHLLILVSRILTILSLVLAFSQPFIPKNNFNGKTGTTEVGIYLDNSFSMNSEGKFGYLFELAKNKAFNILDAYSNSTLFVFEDNDLEPKYQHLLNKETVFEFLQQQQISANTQNLSNIVSKFSNAFSVDSNSKKIIYIISDFQKQNADFENFIPDSNLNLVLIPLTVEKTNNIYIDSVWFESPFRLFEKEEKLFVNIKNSSEENFLEIPINLYLNNTLKTVSNFNISGNSETIVELDYTNTKKGIINCRVELTDYPITFDNSFYFNYTIKDKINVMIINEKSNNLYLNKLFSNDENINLTNFNSGNIKTSEFPKQELIILCQLKEFSSGLITEIINFITNGGNVLVIPDIDGNITSYNKLLVSLNSDSYKNIDTTDTYIENINFNNIIYTDVFKEIDENSELPVLKEYFKFNKTTFSNDIILLEAENNVKVLSANKYEKGNLYVLNVPLDEEFGNFALHPLFVPTIYNIALYSTSTNNLYYTIGQDNIVSLEKIQIENTENMQIINFTDTYEFIPQIISNSGNVLKFNLMNNVKEAGNYFIQSSGKKITGLSFNYKRDESVLDFYDEISISSILTEIDYANFSFINNDIISIEHEIDKLNNGKQLWKLFIILSLIFIGIEIALIKLWK